MKPEFKNAQDEYDYYNDDSGDGSGIALAFLAIIVILIAIIGTIIYFVL